MFKYLTHKIFKLVLILFLFCNSFSVFADYSTKQIDSLENLLKKAKGLDAIELMYEIGKGYLDNDEDEKFTETNLYIKKLNAFSNGSQNNYGKALGKMLQSNIQANQEKLDESLKTYGDALSLLKKVPNRNVIQDIKVARIYFFIADLYIRKFNISKGVDYLLKTIKLAEKLKEKNLVPFIARMKKDGIDPGKEVSIKEAVDYIKADRKSVV